MIRNWECRYGLLRPMRGPNRYRIYTDEDVALLRYLREELEKGESIGELGAAGRHELVARLRATAPATALAGEPYERLLAELLSALDAFDRAAFERRLNGAMAVVPLEEALSSILLRSRRGWASWGTMDV